MANKIKSSDIADFEVITKEAEALAAALSNISKQQNEISKNNAKSTASFKDSAAVLNEVDKTTKSLSDTQKQLEAVKRKNQQAASAENKELIAQRLILAETNKQIKQNIQEETSAYAELNNARTKAKKTLLDLVAAQGLETEAVNKARNDFEDLNKKVLAADHAAGDFSKNVGNYPAVLGGFSDSLKGLGVPLNDVVDNTIGFVQAGKGFVDSLGEVNNMVSSSIRTMIGYRTASQNAAVSQSEMAVATQANAVAVTEVAVAETEATAATWRFNASLFANPIIAITAGIVASIIVIYAFVKATSEANKLTEESVLKNENLIKSLNDLEYAFKNINKELEFQTNRTLALAAANGKSSAEIRALTLSLAQQETAEKKLNSAKADALVLAAERALRDSEADEETQKRLKETLDSAIKFSQEQSQILQESYKKQRQITTDNEVQIAQEKTDARKKSEEADKKAREKALTDQKEANKKRIEEEKAFQKALRDAEMSEAEKKLSDSRENMERQNDEIEKSEAQAYKITMDSIAKSISDQMAIAKKGANQRLISENDALSEVADLYNSGLISYEEAESRQTKIKEAGVKERKKLEQESLQSIIDSLEKLNSTGLLNKDQVEQLDELKLKLGELKDELAKPIEEGGIDKWLSKNKDLVDASMEAFNGLAGIGKEMNANKMAELEEEGEAIEERYTKEIAFAGDNQKEIRKIELKKSLDLAELEKKKKKAQHDAAVYDKAVALTQATIQGALAVVSSLKTLNPFIIGLTAVASAAAIAQVAVQKIPAYAKGTSNAKGGLSIVGEEGQELVTTPSGSQFLTPKSASFINLERGSKVNTARETMAILANQKQPVNVNVNTKENVSVLFDENGVRKLTSRKGFLETRYGQ